MSEEETRVTVRQHPALTHIAEWFTFVATTIVLGIVGIAVYMVRQYLPIVGYIVLVSFAILPAIGLIIIIVWVLKFIFKSEYIEIGPSGTLIKWFNRVTEYNPLGVKEYRSKNSSEKKQEEKIEIPPLLALLRENVLGMGELLLGYHVDGTSRYGSWDDLRTFVVAGKSRSGKTVTMVFFIVQALLEGAEVWVCDPHYSKKTGLLKVLEPLIPFLRVARTDTEILQLVTDFRNEMRARVSAKSRMGDSEAGFKPMLLVIDEWSKLLRDLDTVEIEVLVNTVLGCAEEYAGYNGYALLAGHEWTARESGGKKGAAIRRGFHAIFVHRLDEDYAKFLLNHSRGRKIARTAPNLPTGHSHFQDSEGEMDYLIIPYYGREKEAVYEVSNMLKGLPSPEEHKQLEAPLNMPAPFYTASTQVINMPAQPNIPLLKPAYVPNFTAQAEEETIEQVNEKDVNRLDLKNTVIRLHKRGVALRDISYAVGLYGSNYPQFKTLCDELGIKPNLSPQVK